ncbi:MAG: putative peptidoglycan glycosyltransferase FtsW [Armatimonadetes bacterium]|nr:putative peptidoglycan glycosyltransferase FtsW [Armatimonadota bacterium]
MRNRIKLVASDKGLLFAVVVLLITGIALVFDASYARQGEFMNDIWRKARLQLMFACLGMPLMYAASRMSFGFIRRWHKPLLYFSATLLLLVLVPGIGTKVKGAQSYLRFPGGFGLQPSELVKLAIVLYLASSLSRPRVFAKKAPQAWIIPLAVGVFLIGLIAIERDLGTAAIVIGICFAMFFAAGARKRYILLSGIVVSGLVTLAMTFLPHCQVRWRAYVDPWAHQSIEGYQTIHSLIALGTGGIFGVGACEGREKLGYTPAVWTDYIFSTTVGEELGIIGSVLLLGLFAFLIYRGLDVSRKCKSAYGNVLGVGLTTMIGFQTLLNIAVAINLIPATGVPLPFISYGGSSLVTMMIAAGILLSISRQVNIEPEERGSHESSADRRRDRRPHISGNKRRSGGSGGRSGR